MCAIFYSSVSLSAKKIPASCILMGCRGWPSIILLVKKSLSENTILDSLGFFVEYIVLPRCVVLIRGP